MSKATTTLLKRYVCILNITSTKYICSEYIQTLLKEDYGIDVYLRGVQRDLKFLHYVGAVECKGNTPKGWSEKMLSFREGVMKDISRSEDYVELKASDLAQMNSVAISKYIDRLEQMYYDKKTVAMYYYNQAYKDERESSNETSNR